MKLTTRVSIGRGVVCRVVTLFFILLLALLTGSSPLQAAKTPAPANKDHVPAGVSASDWQSIRAAHEAWKHAVEPVKGGWQARNPAQQWTTKFDGRGFEAKPHNAEWTWGLELRSYGAGEEQRGVGGKPSVKTEGHRLAYHWDDTVQEWYVNDGRGLEHGFSVQERPPGPIDAPLTFVLATRGPLRAAVTGDARAVDYRDASGKTVLTYSGLRVYDADGRELEARFAPAKDGVALHVDAKDARYPLLIDPVAQQAYLKASNTGATDRFGTAIAVAGDIVIVGAPFEDSSTTGVNSTPNDNAADAGAAYVFVRNGATWTQQAYLKASNTGAGDQFGSAVAVSDDAVVVGAPLEDSSTTGINSTPNDLGLNAGAAYVFVRTGTTWTQQAYIKALNSERYDVFGTSVALSGATAIIGAPGEDSGTTGVNSTPNESSPDSGAAYVFFRTGTAWNQQAYLKASNTDAVPSFEEFGGMYKEGDSFGSSVAVSGVTVAVGAPYEDGSSTGVNGAANENARHAGAAYVFVRTGTTWAQQAYAKASNAGSGDLFGDSVSVSGDLLVVGAPMEDSSATGVNSASNENALDAGAAYAFVRSGSNWSQQAYLKASNAQSEDFFGSDVAASGDILAVGSPGEDSNTTGAGSNPNEGALFSGAAYAFVRVGGEWSQEAYIKSSNTGAGDRFGSALALSGDTLLVSAPLEDSNTSGVNSVPNDPNANYDAGAAYAFIVTPPALWDESLDGPLSSDVAMPTKLSPVLGVNTIIAAVGGGSPRDLFSFTLPQGRVLTSAVLKSYASADDVAWIGLQSGPAWTIELNQANIGQMVAQQHFGKADIGKSLLGFSADKPLGAGTYTFRAQQLGASSSYRLELTLAAASPTTPPPAPPGSAITSAAAAEGTVGKPFAYQIMANHSPSTYAATGLPAGLSVGATGKITGTPRIAGSFTVNISANNPGSGTVFAVLALNVAKGAQSINFKPAPMLKFKSNGKVRLVASASPLSRVPVVFKSSNPKVLSINGNTATIKARGKVTITASRVGNANYLPAKAVSRTITIK